MRKFTILILVIAVALGGCASLRNPFASGKFNSAFWKADVAAVKAAAKGTLDDVRAVMAELCPMTSDVLAVANDPTNQELARAVVSDSAVQKNVNNVNSAVRLLDDACRIGDATSAKGILVAAASAINDAKVIFAK